MEYTYEIIMSDHGSEIIKRTNAEGKESWIPLDPANSDYQAYLASLENLEDQDANS
jgi:hypothetical protein